MAEFPSTCKESISSMYTKIQQASLRCRIKMKFEDIKLERLLAHHTKEKLRQDLLDEETLHWYHFRNKIEYQREIARRRYGSIPVGMVRYLKPKDEYERQLEKAKEEAELALEEQRLFLAATTSKMPDDPTEEHPTTSQNSEMQDESRPGPFVPSFGADYSHKNQDKSKK
ncbi:uncharacterized protein DMAD_01092 [Drosophila madeirensis]|uniref:Uncharacterized protein n=1 Tax=Drosophila madeirensis TaxID=30013 RepID=A0AAU9G071_DROMD